MQGIHPTQVELEEARNVICTAILETFRNVLCECFESQVQVNPSEASDFLYEVGENE